MWVAASAGRPGTRTNRRDSKTTHDILGRRTIHPFPARMAPGPVWDVMAESDKPLRVLDPMCGSGTVPAISRACGHHGMGVDMDPLAVLISRVWTTAADQSAIKDEAASVLDKSRRVLASLPTRDAYPDDTDAETQRFVRFWFDDYARRQLAALARAIADVGDGVIQDVLWCAFSRLIITKRSGASLAMDLSHSRPHKAFRRAPARPFSKFMSAAGRVADGCVDYDTRGAMPPTRVCEGDARGLPLDDGSVDVVVTSPPHLNAIDYLRCSKFSLIWMGHTIKEIRRTRESSIGAASGGCGGGGYARNVISGLDIRLDPKGESVLVRYVEDMRRAVRETARVLVGGGRAVYVIGENTVRGTFIPNSRIMEELASGAGLQCVERRSRELPPSRRYLPPPSARTTALDGRMRREAVLTFIKP